MLENYKKFKSVMALKGYEVMVKKDGGVVCKRVGEKPLIQKDKRAKHRNCTAKFIAGLGTVWS